MNIDNLSPKVPRNMAKGQSAIGDVKIATSLACSDEVHDNNVARGLIVLAATTKIVYNRPIVVMVSKVVAVDKESPDSFSVDFQTLSGRVALFHWTR